MSTLPTVRGITHLVVTPAPSSKEAETSGIIATAQLCFGPGDDNYIANVDYIKGPNGPVWRLPATVYEKNGKKIPVPVFGGLVAEEISRQAARAIERIKKSAGGFKWGRIYHVPCGEAGEVQELKTEARVA